MKNTQEKLKIHYNSTWWEVHTESLPAISIAQFNPYHGHNGPEKFDFETGQAYARLMVDAPGMKEALELIRGTIELTTPKEQIIPDIITILDNLKNTQ